jgi:hypothetical protein
MERLYTEMHWRPVSAWAEWGDEDGLCIPTPAAAAAAGAGASPAAGRGRFEAGGALAESPQEVRRRVEQMWRELDLVYRRRAGRDEWEFRVQLIRNEVARQKARDKAARQAAGGSDGGGRGAWWGRATKWFRRRGPGVDGD